MFSQQKLPLLHSDREQGRQEYHKSISSKGEQWIILECGLSPNSVLCGRSQSHSRLWGSVRIFGDPQMVPQMASWVIYPQSTSASMEPCGSQILANCSYDKLQQLRSSSHFQVYPAIWRLAVDNETATTTTMTLITGADSAAFDGVLSVWGETIILVLVRD